jgi:hypothetical protein
MRRAATTFVMLALLAMIVAPVAAADKPIREPAPAPSEFTIDASICGFDVLAQFGGEGTGASSLPTPLRAPD